MSEGPVAILAGGGQLPLRLVEHLERQGRTHRILAFRGFAEPALRTRPNAKTMDLLDIAGITGTLAAWKPSCVSLVGAVHRPGFSALLGAYSLFHNQQEVREAISRGDDHLLRRAVTLLEERGHRVVGAHELAPSLVASPELRGAVQPDVEGRVAIAFGLDVLASLSHYDIGQATVVAGRRVLAVEGPEGTDRMLARVRGQRRSWWPLRLGQEGGVLVKAAKRGQDLRVDMPTIGPRTVREAGRAGLKGIAIGAGSTIVLDQERTLAEANRLGLFVTAVRLPWMEGANG